MSSTVETSCMTGTSETDVQYLWSERTLSVCLCVCSVHTAYISINMGRILMKLGGKVYTV